MKSKEIKKLCISSFLALLLGFFLFLLFNTLLFHRYKSNLVANNRYIIGSILENHPELENEIIKDLTSKKVYSEVGQQTLEKYGLNDIEYLDFISDINDLKMNILFYSAVFVLVFFCVIGFVYFYFIRKQYLQIEELNEYMVKVLNGDYSFDIRDYDESMMSRLRNDIYRMTSRLKNQNENALRDKKYLETVLSDISHQLKTPLTSMYVMNDILYENKISEKERKEFLIKNKKQLERIEWLVTSLLKISRLDSGMVKLKKEKISIQKLLEKAVEPITIALELKKQKVIIEKKEDLFLTCDINWTVEVLLNILKNAHEHGNESSDIFISYGKNALYTYITITDIGEEIKEKDIKNIFKRFYKGNTRKESIGIGLNMAYTIMEKQNGRIEVESKKKKEVTFTLKFFRNVI